MRNENDMQTAEVLQTQKKASRKRNDAYVGEYMERYIQTLVTRGRYRTAEAYRETLSCYMRYRKGKDLPLRKINSNEMEGFEASLKSRGLALNTISFYMHILRAVYNRACEEFGFSHRTHPFRNVFTGRERTVKRAVSIRTIRSLKKLDLHDQPKLDVARDIFLLSFYLRGMSFIDMAYLRRRNLRDNTLIYRRRKTGQQLVIRWEKCMQDILDKYPTNETGYLLPIITDPVLDDRQQYKTRMNTFNRRLKTLSTMVRSQLPLSMYVARHSWASIAHSMHVPISVISEGLGHDSEATTRIYLAALDTRVIDRANRLILKSL